MAEETTGAVEAAPTPTPPEAAPAASETPAPTPTETPAAPAEAPVAPEAPAEEEVEHEVENAPGDVATVAAEIVASAPAHESLAIAEQFETAANEINRTLDRLPSPAHSIRFSALHSDTVTKTLPKRGTEGVRQVQIVKE